MTAAYLSHDKLPRVNKVQLFSAKPKSWWTEMWSPTNFWRSVHKSSI